MDDDGTSCISDVSTSWCSHGINSGLLARLTEHTAPYISASWIPVRLCSHNVKGMLKCSKNASASIKRGCRMCIMCTMPRISTMGHLLGTFMMHILLQNTRALSVKKCSVNIAWFGISWDLKIKGASKGIVSSRYEIPSMSNWRGLTAATSCWSLERNDSGDIIVHFLSSWLKSATDFPSTNAPSF